MQDSSTGQRQLKDFILVFTSIICSQKKFEKTLNSFKLCDTLSLG